MRIIFGGYGYDWLILTNRLTNWLLEKAGQPKMSFSKKIKNKVKKAVAWISDFEQTAAELAIDKQYDVVICGHIHHPQSRIVETKKGKVHYLNSGDWIENLTALEYDGEHWSIYHYDDAAFNSTPVIYMKSGPAVLSVVTDEITFTFNSLLIK